MAVDWLANNLYIMDPDLKKMVICAKYNSVCTSFHIPSAGAFRSIALNPHKGQVAFLYLDFILETILLICCESFGHIEAFD